MNEKWDLETRNRKSAPKKGRRAGLGFGFSLSPREDEYEDVSDMGSPTRGMSSPPKGRKTGGWAGESLKSAKKLASASLLEQELLDNRNAGSDDDIPIIPNLDDYAEDDLTNQIARAPMVSVNRVATYKELETDLLKHAAFASLEEINLRPLTRFLYPEPALEDDDVPWTRESLFAEIVAGTNEEKQKIL